MNRSSHGLALALALTGLSACSAIPGDGGSTEVAAPSLAVAVPISAAVVRLPEAAGRIVSVVERRTPERRLQVVTLAGDGSGVAADRIEASLSPHRPGDLGTRRSAEEIVAEFAPTLPDRTVRIGDRPIVSAAGAFGWATARGDRGGLCLVAWTDTVIDRGTGVVATIDDRAQDLEVRIRLCRRGASEADLVGWLAATRVGPG
jgi:hypothetical protein